MKIIIYTLLAIGLPMFFVILSNSFPNMPEGLRLLFVILVPASLFYFSFKASDLMYEASEHSKKTGFSKKEKKQ